MEILKILFLRPEKIKLIFLSFFIFGISFSQNRKIDSVFTLLKNDKEDTNKINHLLFLGWQLKNGNPDTAIVLFSQSLSLSEKLKWNKGRANSLGRLGACYFLKADFPKALDYYLKALRIDEESGNKTGVGNHLANIGLVYFDLGEYDKALEYQLRSLKMGEELKDKGAIAKRLGNVGNVYLARAGDLKIGKQMQDSLLSIALNYYLKALEIDEELGNKSGMAVKLGNIGLVYSDRGDYEKALVYYFRYLKLAIEEENKNYEAIALGTIGTLYTSQKKYKDAYTYLTRALAIDDSIGVLDGSEYDYKQLSKLYEASDVSLPDTIGGKLLNKEQMRLRALYYHKKYISIRDALFSEENKKQLVRKEMNFEFEKKEAATKAEQDKKNAIQEADAKKQRIVLLLVVVGLILVAVFALFIFRSLQIARKQKVIIEHQKELVEEKQKEILDSIHYAKRIQTALITSEKYFFRNLNRLNK